jgi:hypothetical protein
MVWIGREGNAGLKRDLELEIKCWNDQREEEGIKHRWFTTICEKTVLIQFSRRYVRKRFWLNFHDDM